MASTNIVPTSLIVKSNTDIASDIRRTIYNGLIQFGLATNPNVGVGSDWGIGAQAVANEVTVPSSNAIVLANQMMPDTATGTNLDRILGFYGLTRRPASQSFGSVIVPTVGNSSFIPAGTQLADSSGNLFSVITGGVYGTGSSINVASVSTGASVNEEGGTVLTWQKTPPYFPNTVTVSLTNPITGGQAVENDATASARLLSYLGNPPGGGNPSQIIKWAQASSPTIQTAFVYAAARGPGTYDVACVSYSGENGEDGYRNTNSTVIANQAAPYIQGQMPQFADGYICTVANYPMDIAIQISLPLPANAIPAGPGGGWLDAQPLSVSAAKPAIRVVDGYNLSGNTSGVPQNTATSFWVDFPVAPLNGVIYSVSYVSPVTQTLYQAQTSGTYIPATNYASISSYTSMYYITINSPFYQNSVTSTIIQAGNYIFPSAANTATYVSNLLSYFSTMGPGERVSNGNLIPRALRQPSQQITFPYKIDARMLKAIINSGPEVYDAIFGTVSGTTFYGSYLNSGTAPTSSFVPYTTLSLSSDPAYANSSPPTTYNYYGTMIAPANIFTPNNIGFFYLNGN